MLAGLPLRDQTLERIYLLLPSQECQDVACWLLGMYLQHSLEDSIQIAVHRLGQVEHLDRMLPSLQVGNPNQAQAFCPVVIHCADLDVHLA